MKKSESKNVTAGKTSATKKATPIGVQRGVREIAFLLVVTLAVFVAAALASYHPKDPSLVFLSGPDGHIHNMGGRVGAWLSALLFFVIGQLAWFTPLLMVVGAWYVIRSPKDDNEVGLHNSHWGIPLLGILLLLVSVCGLLSLMFNVEPKQWPIASAGGYIGREASQVLIGGLNAWGAGLVLIALFPIAMTMTTGVLWLQILKRIYDSISAKLKNLRADFVSRREAKQDLADNRPIFTQAAPAGLEQKQSPASKLINKLPVKSPAKKTAVAKASNSKTADEPIEEITAPEIEDNRSRGASVNQVKVQQGELPPLDLLDMPGSQAHGYSQEELDGMAQLVETKLADFGVKVGIVSVHTGPVITRFELSPAAGVKGSQILNLAKDLARSLSVISVRVVEVIPGKPYVGLEVPNQKRQMVSMRDVLQSQDYRDANSSLAVVLGKDISGQPAVTDLGKMPHVLVAGTTGAGKSVAINVILLSLLFNARPEEVKLILVDPKMLELSVYEGIPHLLTPVVTDMKDAANALRWSVAEMERRYKLMAALGVRNIAGYNKKVKAAIEAGEPIADPLYEAKPNPFVGDLEEPAPAEDIPTLEPMPYIVITVDELSDLMLTVGKKVEEFILRLAQKARAAGIHLILATQRPSVDVITGLIRANIPSRIAFRVASKIDSRTILDQGGAETLLGMGDMLFSLAGSQALQRIHGAFVDDHEVHNVVAFLKKQGKPQYDESIVQDVEEAAAGGNGDLFAEGGGDAGGAESDPLYDQAVQVVTETRRASVSGVQRRLRIGYNRAARLVEAMEAAGVVGAPAHNGVREVIAPPPVE